MLLALVALTGQAQNKVWNDVITAHTNTSNTVTVTKVAFYDDRTEVSLHVDYVAGQWIRIMKDTFLGVDKKRYAAKRTTVLTLGEQYILPTDTLDFDIIFEPVPQDVKSINLIEPNGWQFANIRSASILPTGILNTYWRDEATGDWLIGIDRHHVIYKSKIYDMATLTEKKDAYTLQLTDGPTIQVGKMKKGLRTFTIGKDKPVVCSIITTATLPDYPTKDTRTGFVDNNFRMGDSVTIVGWLKDMPPGMLEQNPEFNVMFENILTDNENSHFAKMDSLGRFTLKMPLMNTSEVFIDWRRTTIQTVLEPGKTYFLLYNFWTGQKLWMGDDVRVQNELLKYARSRALRSAAPVPYNEQNVDLMAYWAKCDSARLIQEARLKALQESHPTLSQRFVDYQAGYFRTEQGHNMMQARYCAQGRPVPREYVDYVGKNFWQKAPKPYTQYRDFNTFMRDFLNQVENDRGHVELTDAEFFKRFEEEGMIVLTDEEKATWATYVKEKPQVQAKINAAKTKEEKMAIAEAYDNSETFAKVKALVERYEPILNTFGTLHLLDIVDSLGSDRTLRDLVLAQRLLHRIDGTRQPLDSATLALAEAKIQLPVALTSVKSLNDKYLALQRRDISKSPSLKTAEDLANMSDGEKMLRKLIEPYQGKIILLDIWGTWCGPCKAALSHSQQEYARLKDYDLVYLYLANASPDESWKSVIKEYEVLGDNVVHYNLPAAQQNAIEHFLKVNSFPTYKLIDRDGTILEVNANPRDLEGLARLLDQMK